MKQHCYAFHAGIGKARLEGLIRGEGGAIRPGDIGCSFLDKFYRKKLLL